MSVCNIQLASDLTLKLSLLVDMFTSAILMDKSAQSQTETTHKNTQKKLYFVGPLYLFGN